MLLLLHLLVLCFLAAAQRTEFRQFHAYVGGGDGLKAVEVAEKKSISATCAPLYAMHAQTDKLTDIALKLHLWPHLTTSSSSNTKVRPENILFGTALALEKVWEHQHPPNCSDAQFLIAGGHNGGFGSEIHVLGAALGLAMDMGRVYLQNPFLSLSSQWEVENEFCRLRNKTNLECYFEPWSSCTIFDALGPNALKILKQAKDLGYPNDAIKAPAFHYSTADVIPKRKKAVNSGYRKRFAKEKLVICRTPGVLKHGVIPSMFENIVSCSPMRIDLGYYWWRAISTAYLVRPNKYALQWMKDNEIARFDSTMAQQAVGFYVRRGDKAQEMVLVPVGSYIAAMQQLFHRKIIQEANNSTQPIFLASEDSDVIKEMATWQYSNPHYVVKFTEVFDRKGLLAEKSSKRGVRLDDKKFHHEHEYLSMLLNIQYLLRASSWVCTLASNFCRLIDELRATVAMKASHPFVDLSAETCRKPPCIYGGFLSLGW